jgi:arginase
VQTWDRQSTIRAKIGVLGIPYDASSSYLRGSSDAPPLIRKAFHSDSSNLWTENGTDLGAEELLADAGDLVFEAEIDVWEEIERGVKVVLEAGLHPLCLGGDHSVTFPIIKAMATRYDDLTILHFDAHPDLYQDFEGNPYSHASPFARIMEAGIVARLVQIGIRTMNGHQREQAERYGVEVIEMKDWNDEFVMAADRPLYISFDMDCLDPAFAPGVSHWEPGGFSTRQVLHVIQGLHAPLVGADIVEYNPRVETPITGMVAAKVFKEIAAKMLVSDK